MQVLQNLLALLKLETIEQGLYRGQSQDLGFKAVFGGQVMGQALSAAKERAFHALCAKSAISLSQSQLWRALNLSTQALQPPLRCFG